MMPKVPEPIHVVAFSMDELQSILKHVKALGLPEKEHEALRALVESYAFLLDEIQDKEASVERLRQLVFGATTETKANVRKRAGKSGTGAKEKPKTKPKRKGHGRIPAEAYTGAERVKVPHESLRPGDRCPHAGCSGKVYARDARTVVRIRGSAPFVATVYERECLRCHLCGEVFGAKMPAEIGEEKFDETVASMAAFLRYGNGLPMNRIEGLQNVMGVPFPASVQWELMRDAAKAMEPAYSELVRQAAQGDVLMNDDTPMRILDFLVEQKKREERGEKPPDRTGTFTSGIVSESPGGRRIVLYFTGQRHAGENLADVLAKRASGLDPPLQMCDGLDRNVPGAMKTILGNCLAHARRQFVDVVSGFPDEVEHVIDELSLVYEHDARARSAGMSAEERLRLHQEESGPVMDRLKIWLEGLLTEKKVEPNSGLGKAIAYSLKRWERLTLFLRQAGAPLDNNLTERMLKKAIAHRKNSLFYKTANGAAVGDLYMALIATAKLAKADPFDYLNELQRHAQQVAARPAEWMPWNYRETLGRSTTTD
jgi:transposase